MSEREATEKKFEDIDAMFVQAAQGFESSGDRIVLHGIASSTVYFGDRPQRVAGHIGTDEFVELWDEGDDSFEKDPPNAVLSFVGNGATPEEVVITISAPDLEGDDLSYSAKVLEGQLPASAGGCSLFIDPFGRPLTPVSVAGMRRRTRRRTRRRVGRRI